MITNETLASLYEANASLIGVEFETNEDRINSPTGSTDMGNVSHLVPSIHPMFYIGCDSMNHTKDFTKYSGVYILPSCVFALFESL